MQCGKRAGGAEQASRPLALASRHGSRFATVNGYAGVPLDVRNRRKIGEELEGRLLIAEREIDRLALCELRFDVAKAEKGR